LTDGGIGKTEDIAAAERILPGWERLSCWKIRVWGTIRLWTDPNGQVAWDFSFLPIPSVMEIGNLPSAVKADHESPPDKTDLLRFSSGIFKLS